MKIIGIDSGTVTGISIFDVAEQKFDFVGSMAIHRAMKMVADTKPALVRVEDARLRKWFTGGKEKAQGAGSIKRDAKIWEDFLTDENLFFEMVAPMSNVTKLSAADFKRRTGWQMGTNSHSRDASMLVFGLSQRNVENIIRTLSRPQIGVKTFDALFRGEM